MGIQLAKGRKEYLFYYRGEEKGGGGTQRKRAILIQVISLLARGHSQSMYAASIFGINKELYKDCKTSSKFFF